MYPLWSIYRRGTAAYVREIVTRESLLWSQSPGTRITESNCVVMYSSVEITKHKDSLELTMGYSCDHTWTWVLLMHRRQGEVQVEGSRCTGPGKSRSGAVMRLAASAALAGTSAETQPEPWEFEQLLYGTCAGKAAVFSLVSIWGLRLSTSSWHCSPLEGGESTIPGHPVTSQVLP